MSKFEKFIKSTAAAVCFVDNVQLADRSALTVDNVKTWVIKCIKDYAAFRLELLTQPDSRAEKIKREVLEKLIKAGIKYAAARFLIPIDSNNIDRYVEKYLPVVVEYVENLKIELFTLVLNAADNAT